MGIVQGQELDSMTPVGPSSSGQPVTVGQMLGQLPGVAMPSSSLGEAVGPPHKVLLGSWAAWGACLQHSRLSHPN